MKRTVLITGGATGLGREIARLFCADGYQTVINYHHSRRDALSLEEELSRIGDAQALCADVSDPAQVDAMFQKIQERFGGVALLVNNAAVSSVKVLQDITAGEWDHTFGVNVKGMFLCAKAALPFMLKNKRGNIINISSVWGIAGASCETHYSASKAAVIGFTKALAKELAPSGIRVNCVAPGAMETPMNSHLSAAEKERLAKDIPLGRLAAPEEIARCVLFLDSKGAEYITGQVLSPNGGLVI